MKIKTLPLTLDLQKQAAQSMNSLPSQILERCQQLLGFEQTAVKSNNDNQNKKYGTTTRKNQRSTKRSVE